MLPAGARLIPVLHELELVHALPRLQRFSLHRRHPLVQLPAARLQASNVATQAPRLAGRQLPQVRLALHLAAASDQPGLRVRDLQPHVAQVLLQHLRVLLILFHLDLRTLQLSLERLSRKGGTRLDRAWATAASDTPLLLLEERE